MDEFETQKAQDDTNRSGRSRIASTSRQHSSAEGHSPSPMSFPSEEASGSHPRRSLEREQSRSEDDGTDDLTTKGKKRKRLAKACSACHVGLKYPSLPNHLS